MVKHNFRRERLPKLRFETIFVDILKSVRIEVKTENHQ